MFLGKSAAIFALQAVFSRLKDEAQTSEDRGHSPRRETGSTGQQMPRLWVISALRMLSILMFLAPVPDPSWSILIQEAVKTCTLSPGILGSWNTLGYNSKYPATLLNPGDCNLSIQEFAHQPLWYYALKQARLRFFCSLDAVVPPPRSR